MSYPLEHSITRASVQNTATNRSVVPTARSFRFCNLAVKIGLISRSTRLCVTGGAGGYAAQPGLFLSDPTSRSMRSRLQALDRSRASAPEAGSSCRTAPAPSMASRGSSTQLHVAQAKRQWHGRE